MADRAHTAGWDAVSFKVRLGLPGGQNSDFMAIAPFVDAISQRNSAAVKPAFDLTIDSGVDSDAPLMKSVVAQHFKKIFLRADESLANLRGVSGLDPKQDHHNDDTHGSAADHTYDIAALNPQFLRVSAVPVAGTANTVPSLAFSTISFLDCANQPYILIGSHISFQSALISAFNSVLDLVNIFAETQGSTPRSPRQQVFLGLNSQKILIEFNSGLCPGYLRKNTTEYVL